GGLALVVFQAVLFLVVGHGAQAEPDFLFRFAHLDDFVIVFVADVHGRLLRPAASRKPRHFGEVAQALHPFGKLHKGSETGQTAHAAMHRVAHLMVLEVALQASGCNCLMPRERRCEAESIFRITACTIMPFLRISLGCLTRFVQERSLTCTRPSMPSSISMKAPKSVILRTRPSTTLPTL